MDTTPNEAVKAYRPREACKALGDISLATLYRRIADGTLDAKKIVTLITDESIRSALKNAPSVRAA